MNLQLLSKLTVGTKDKFQNKLITYDFSLSVLFLSQVLSE